MKRIMSAAIAAGLTVLFVAAFPQGKSQKAVHQQKYMQVMPMTSDSSMMNMMMDRIASDSHWRTMMMQRMINRADIDSSWMRSMGEMMWGNGQMHSMMMHMMDNGMMGNGMMHHDMMH
jgi:hypothetical protein